ncbi:MAG: SigE family RNA polymerase sigma factor [Acidimicrobiaceae bacterium]|nr:SigE family RNA polymerase sigma factor [Acidimicrobiaceae bacterium]
MRLWSGVEVAGPDDEFTALVGDRLPALQRVARLLVGGGDVADDLVAEAIARTLPRWRAGTVADPVAYLRRVVVNLARRRWRRRRLGIDRDRAALDWLPAGGDAEAGVIERERVLRALAALPARRRAVVVLRFYEDLGEAEIAAALGVSVGTVKSTLARALGQLRGTLGALDEA